MGEKKLGSFSVTRKNLSSFLNWVMAPLGDNYDEAYFNLSEDSVRTISNAGESVMAYCTFTEAFIEDIELADSVDEKAGMEAILKVPTIRDYLDFIGGKRITVEFYGDDSNRGATSMVLYGDLKASFYLPSSNSNYETKQVGIVEKYDDDNRYIRNDGEPMDTSFETTMEEVSRIVEISDFDDITMSNYPIVIEDGEFKLHAEGEDQRQVVSGNLHAENIEGPDIDNVYSRGISELASNLSGGVTIDTEQDYPISVVRETNDGSIELRYAILPATQA